MKGIFSDEWVKEWAKEINNSDTYRDVGRDWNEPIVLTMQADPAMGVEEEVSAYLELSGGECKEARIATAEDIESAPYTITATPEVWKSLLDGRLDIARALVRGQMKAVKGDRGRLSSNIQGARELLGAAQRVYERVPREQLPVGFQG
ncbi:SCP2 sterol-binding domain-containing protein [Rubrobacter calidifluminis]|uniref:SCP2 sterol-binding domain-containing protein n=1 Tax=Rubrobacter calidifluminis TaxID=1392640 RepID=UPI00236314B3|nr:SCP2 sterol-binding domain-containing protein [Rubrobacter calidifluminis]